MQFRIADTFTDSLARLTGVVAGVDQDIAQAPEDQAALILDASLPIRRQLIELLASPEEVIPLLPEAELFIIYLVMALVLLFRPAGLFAPAQARRI